MKKKTVVDVVSESKKEVASGTVHEMEEKKQFDPASVKAESTVYHNVFGSGTIRKIVDRKIYVEFGCGLRTFTHPGAFEKGYLRII